MNTLITIFFPQAYTYGVERSVRYLWPPFADQYAEVTVASEGVIEDYGAHPVTLRFDNVFIPEQKMKETLAAGNCLVMYENELYQVLTIRARRADNVVSLLCTDTADYQASDFKELSADSKTLVAGDAILGIKTEGTP